MKRIRSFILVALLLTTLTGCGTQKVQNNDSKTNDTTATEATTNKVEDTATSDTKQDSIDTKNTDSDTKQDSANTKNADSDAKQDSTNTKNADNDAKQDNTNGEDPTFYGTWQIKKVIGAAKISAGVNEDIIGKKITISRHSATLANESYNNTENKISEKLDKDLGKNTHISDMGSNAYAIEEITVCNKDNNVDIMTLYERDDGVLIYYLDGVYYETTKVS